MFLPTRTKHQHPPPLGFKSTRAFPIPSPEPRAIQKTWSSSSNIGLAGPVPNCLNQWNFHSYIFFDLITHVCSRVCVPRRFLARGKRKSRTSDSLMMKSAKRCQAPASDAASVQPPQKRIQTMTEDGTTEIKGLGDAKVRATHKKRFL